MQRPNQKKKTERNPSRSMLLLLACFAAQQANVYNELIDANNRLLQAALTYKRFEILPMESCAASLRDMNRFFEANFYH